VYRKSEINVVFEGNCSFRKQHAIVNYIKMNEGDKKFIFEGNEHVEPPALRVIQYTGCQKK